MGGGTVTACANPRKLAAHDLDLRTPTIVPVLDVLGAPVLIGGVAQTSIQLSDPVEKPKGQIVYCSICGAMNP
jgi:hypothetical protein